MVNYNAKHAFVVIIKFLMMSFVSAFCLICFRDGTNDGLRYFLRKSMSSNLDLRSEPHAAIFEVSKIAAAIGKGIANY